MVAYLLYFVHHTCLYTHFEGNNWKWNLLNHSRNVLAIKSKHWSTAQATVTVDTVGYYNVIWSDAHIQCKYIISEHCLNERERERERGQTQIRTYTVHTYREAHASLNMQSTVKAEQRFSCYISSVQHQRCHRWLCHGGVMWRSMCSELETRRRRKKRPPSPPAAASVSATGSPGWVARSSGSASPLWVRYPSERPPVSPIYDLWSRTCSDSCGT